MGEFLLISVLAFFIQIVNASLGMGWGTILTPILVLIGYPTIVAVPAVLLSQATGSVAASISHSRLKNASIERGSTELKTIVLIGGLGVVASLLAALLAVNIDKTIVSTYIGVLVLLMGAIILLERQFKFSWKTIVGLGLVSAFNKGISGGGFGPVVTGGQIIGGQEEKKAIAITLVSEIPICLVGFFTYLIANAVRNASQSGLEPTVGGLLASMFSSDIIAWELCLALVVGAFIAAPFGALASKYLRKDILRMVVGCIITLLGCLTLLKIWG